jgi:PBSX family phage terminase large subunit
MLNIFYSILWVIFIYGSSLMKIETDFNFIPKIYDFFVDNPKADIYVIAGGRGKGATWAIADRLIMDSLKAEEFILCTREIKGSVDHSSRRTIESRIIAHGLKDLFTFQNTQTICNRTGSRFIYTGLSKVTEDNVQGVEGITRGWLGEAHTMALSTWQKFEPTVRSNKAIIYIDYNIQFSNTPIHTLLTENPNNFPFEGKKNMAELAYLFLNYKDNIFCPEKTLKIIKRNRKQYSLSDWEWIWLGKLKDASDHYTCDERDVRVAMERVVEYDAKDALIVGCDIAHMGGDEISFYKRRGNKFLDNGRQMVKSRFNNTCDELEAYVNFEKNSILVIDNGHLGCAVADEMENRGYFVERVNFGGTDMHYDKEHSKDCATDMAFNFTSMLKDLELPKCDVLCAQVSQRKWDFLNNKGVRKIESKDEFKKHAVLLEGHTSPDRGDAAWLCCYNKNKVRIQMAMNNVIKVWN